MGVAWKYVEGKFAFEERSGSAGIDYERDPWKMVCERCGLDDCVVPEGGMHGLKNNVGRFAEALRLCPVERAKSRGWGVEEAMGRGSEIGLVEE